MPDVKKLSLQDALSHIEQSCENPVRPRPFFFIVGAGISSPPIKLAWQMIEDFKKEAKRRKRNINPASTLPLDIYSHWFDQAYNSLIERQSYLNKQIKGKYISHANFRLAHILLKQHIGNLVITPNFDNSLSQALTLFGEHPIVYERPETFDLIDAERDEIQIAHVHGSHRFYDLANLKVEIEGQAQDSAGRPSNTATIIENLLIHRSPLVIGYSGWEGDVIMTALTRRLSKTLPLPNNLYWFCYREANIEKLPDVIKLHRNVYFVVPQPELQHISLSSISSAYVVYTPSHTREAERANPPVAMNVELTKSFRQKRVEPSLSAKTVFNQFIRTFNIEVPALTHDPLSFFINQLSTFLPREEKENQAEDIYSIQKVIDRLQQAKFIDEEAVNQDVVSKMEKVRNALRSSNYEGIIEEARALEPTRLSNGQRIELVAALWSAIEEVYGNNKLEVAAHELIIDIGGDFPLSSPNYTIKAILAKAYVRRGLRLYEQQAYDESIAAFDTGISKIGKADKKELNEALAMALVNKAVTLSAQGNNKKALAIYQKVIRLFGKTRNVVLQRGVVRALHNKSVSLRELDRNKEIVPLYIEIEKRFGKESDVDIAEVVASALINKGFFHGVFNEFDEAIGSYDRVLTLYGNSSELSLQKSVARALVNKAITLLSAGEYDKAVAVGDALIRRYRDSDSVSLQQSVSKAFLVQADAFSESGDKERAINIYNKIFSRYLPHDFPVLQEAVAFALVKKGNQYENVQQATNAYDQVIDIFGNSDDPQLQEQVGLALFNKGVKWQEAKELAGAIGIYKEIEKRYGRVDHPIFRSIVSRALVNRGVALIDLKRTKAAIKLYDSIIEKFSKDKDINIESNIAASIFNKGVAFSKVPDKIKANQVFDDLIERFAGNTDEGIRWHVVTAMLGKSRNLHDLKRNPEALEIIEQLLNKFRNTKSTRIKSVLAKAWSNKGYFLSKLNRYDDAERAYNTALRRFGGMSDADFQEAYAIAKNGKAYLLIRKAKADLLNGKRTAANAKLKKAQEIANDALKHDLKDDHIHKFIWGNLGYIAFLLGDMADAKQSFKIAFKIGDDEVYKGALDDAAMYPLPEDKAFVQLVRSVRASL
jgi:tetratricopeptide (TPR) repeat protein